MQRFTATVIREVRVEFEMPDDYRLNDDDGNEIDVDLEPFYDAIYAAIPSGDIRHQSVTAWDEQNTQVL